MDISNIGQSVEIMRKVLEKAVAPGIEDLRGRMTLIEERVSRMDNRLDRIDNRMDSINSNLAAISTSLAQMAAALAMSVADRDRKAS
ncbi:hypothetical protein JKG47_03300 [Acidithiobacillus sp. MC6.1]|nr:hypothetical protein [Acidithiobacillus sp. MC6.1]